MRALLAIFDFPPTGGFPNFIQVPEQVQIKDFFSKSLFKAIDKRVPVGLAGLNILDCHPTSAQAMTSPLRNSGPLSSKFPAGHVSKEAAQSYESTAFQ